MPAHNAIINVNAAPGTLDFDAGSVSADVISEGTSGSGVTVDGVLNKDGAVTATGTVVGVAGTFSGAVSGTTGAFSGDVTTAALTASGAITQTAAAGLGYATGAGGAVAQDTNASNPVTLSKPCGKITTVALTTAAAASERFTVTNTLVAIGDVIVFSTTYTGNGTPVIQAIDVTAGTFDIQITNIHASAAFNAAIIINVVVIKAVAA